MKSGIRGVLVRTGKYQPGDEGKIEPPPTCTVESFPAAVEKIFETFPDQMVQCP